MSEAEFKRLFPHQLHKLRGKKPRKPAQKESPLEAQFDWLVKLHSLPLPVAQFKFHPKRKWALDRSWPDKKIAVEIDGEVNHARYHQTSKDAEKRNAAKEMGWTVIVWTGEMMKKDPLSLIDQLKRALN